MSEPEGCCICGEEYGIGENPEQPDILPCNHTFGSSCIARWLADVEGSRSCPICRTDPADTYWESGIFKQRGPLSGYRSTTWSFEGISHRKQRKPEIYFDIDGVMTKYPETAISLMWQGLIACEDLETASQSIAYNSITTLAFANKAIYKRLRSICIIPRSQPLPPWPFEVLWKVCSRKFHSDLRPVVQGNVWSDVVDAKVIKLAITTAVLKKPQFEIGFPSRFLLLSILIEGTEAIACNRRFTGPGNDIFQKVDGSLPKLQGLLCGYLKNEEHVHDHLDSYTLCNAIRDDVRRKPVELQPNTIAKLKRLATEAYITDWKPEDHITAPARRRSQFSTAGVGVHKPQNMPPTKNPSLQRAARSVMGAFISDLHTTQAFGDAHRLLVRQPSRVAPVVEVEEEDDRGGMYSSEDDDLGGEDEESVEDDQEFRHVEVMFSDQGVPQQLRDPNAMDID